MMVTATAALLSLGCAFVNVVALPQDSLRHAHEAPALAKRQSAPARYVPTANDLASGCANVARVAAAFVRTPEASRASNFQVDAKIAYDCLASIPLEQGPVIEFLDELSKFVQFQSTLAYLARPPERSGQDAVDILAGLENIARGVNSSSITGWNEVEVRVAQLLGSCHEGHLTVSWPIPPLLSFRAPFPLVDLSPDGIQLSKVYVATDISLQRLSGNRFQPSAITRIDGQDVITALDRLAYYEGSQSPDTRWNKLFQSQNPPKQGTFYRRDRYPGANTFTLTFENGTTSEYQYIARALHVPGRSFWPDLQSGQDVWDNIVNVDPIRISGASKKVRARSLEDNEDRGLRGDPLGDLLHRLEARQVGGSNAPPPPEDLIEFGGTFPDTPGVSPYVHDINQVVGGYFMADYENSDSKTAIIDITGFAPDDPNGMFPTLAVQAAVEEFLAEARRRKMEKLIIDVRGNGGGYVNMGLDMYKQLFPSADPNYGTRLRYHPASVRIGQAFSELFNERVLGSLIDAIGGGMGENLSSVQTQLFVQSSYVAVSSLNQFLNLNANGSAFASFEDFIGPRNIYGDQFTATQMIDLHNPIAVGDLSYSITGYEARASYDRNPAPFLPENIVLITDGICASTCGIFADLLRTRQGIRTVVVGGRPNNQPSAAIGGTRGALLIRHNSHMLQIVRIIENSYSPSNEAERAQWDSIFPRPFKLNIAEAGVNWKDNIRATDPTETPLQFYLEAADCRLFYTRETMVRSHDLWNKVDALAWGTDDTCAQGSLKNVTVVSGDENGVPVSIGQNGAGPGSPGDSGPRLTGDNDLDIARWIWYFLPKSLGSPGPAL